MKAAPGCINAAVLEGAALLKLEIDLSGYGVEERDARPEEYGVDVEADFVDEVGLEEGSGEVAATHEADVLSGFRAVFLFEPADESGCVFRYEGNGAAGEFGDVASVSILWAWRLA